MVTKKTLVPLEHDNIEVCDNNYGRTKDLKKNNHLVEELFEKCF